MHNSLPSRIFTLTKTLNEMLTTIILLGIALAIVLIALTVRVHKQSVEYAYTILYGNLLTFKYWISSCEISKANHTTAIARIWLERARPQALIPEYGDLIYEITYIFTKRFADFIQERGSKNNTL